MKLKLDLYLTIPDESPHAALVRSAPDKLKPVAVFPLLMGASNFDMQVELKGVEEMPEMTIAVPFPFPPQQDNGEMK